MNKDHIRAQGFSRLLCPICRKKLSITDTALHCRRQHSFDIGREGYVNLSQPHKGGDVKPMLQARRRFLTQGYYAPLSDAVNAGVVTLLHQRPPAASSSSTVNILDVGCGEGYYLGRLQNMLGRQWQQEGVCAFGMDISKDAIQMAARQYAHACFFVADVKRDMLMADQSVQVLLNIFAPRNPAEFARVIAPHGVLAVVIPDRHHLQELRTALDLMCIEADKEEHIHKQFAGQFTVVEEQTLEYVLHLKTDSLVQLVMMTPNYWHLSSETREALSKMGKTGPTEVTIGFSLLLFQRHGKRK